MKTIISTCLLFLALMACKDVVVKDQTNKNLPPKVDKPLVKAYVAFFEKHPEFHADSFDFPVGKPDAKGYYNAQPFTENDHLGDDWNAVTGGDSDLGDPIYSIANGYVIRAQDEGPGWGNVVRVIHYHPALNPPYIESIYAHCDTMLVKRGLAIKKGEQIATIGNADGAYYAHLHLEIRDSIEMRIGGGYGTDTTGFLNPTAYIRANRSVLK